MAIWLPIFVMVLLCISAVLFVLYARTGRKAYKRFAVLVLKWTGIAALLSVSVFLINLFDALPS